MTMEIKGAARTRVRPIVFSDPALSRAELDVIHTLITSTGLTQDATFDIAHYSLSAPGPADITFGGQALLAYRTSTSSEPALHLPPPQELLREEGLPASRQKAWEGITALARRLVNTSSPLISLSLLESRWTAYLPDGRQMKVVPSRPSETVGEGEVVELRELILLTEMANLLGVTRIEIVQE